MTKSQETRNKQIPNSNDQETIKSQIPMTNDQTIWNQESGIRNLESGIV